MARKVAAFRHSRPGEPYTADEARVLVESGDAPAGMSVRGTLHFGEADEVRLPEGLRCDGLDLTGNAIETLPEGLSVRFRLTLRNCRHLTRLPRGLKAGTLDLAGCTALEGLPEDLEVSFLDISDCRQLKSWPNSARLDFGRLRARNCTGLTQLPPWLKQISQLDLVGCRNIESIPDGLQVSSWIDLAGTGIKRLPDSCRTTALRWRSAPIDERVAFRPNEITAEEVLNERNSEVRRAKLERMGFDRFLEQAEARVLDTDRDAGGERRLFHVELQGDEPLVCVSVICPSTARQYVIRVPPATRSCRAAVAWIAGFDNADDYAPILET
jgi:hypothetical protein